MGKDTNGAEKTKCLPIVEVQNILTELYDLRLNEITGVVEGRKKDENEFKILNENNLYIKLLSNGYRISFSNLVALLNSDFVPMYNPFQNYFDSLPEWKPGDHDYIEEIANCIVALDQEQFNHHFRKMLVRTIACALVDSVFNKHALILVGGEQNSGKSTFIRYLCPPGLSDYISEAIPNDKDGLISLCENFMINLDELSTMSKFELNQLKSLFSKDKVRVRHPFARKSQTDPRRVSFIGSTNEDTFLTDPTGSVRWLCFEIHTVNWAYDKIDIDMVWSQAYYLFKTGFKYQLTVDEIRANESRNEQYQAITQEYDYIQQYLLPGDPFDKDGLFWTTTQIRDYIISKSDRKAEIKSLDKLGKTLKLLGFTRVPKRIGEEKKPAWGYYVKYTD